MRKHLPPFLCATVCMAAAFGVNWFDADVANLSDWPSDGQNKIVQGVGAWTNTAAAVLSGEAGARRLQLGATAEKPLEFEPLASRPAEQTVSIEMNVRFSAGPLPDTVDPQMKGAVTVVENDNGTHAWYGLVKGEGAANVWTPLTGAVPSTGTDTRVRITVRVVEGVRQVRYVVDGISLQSTAGEWAEIVFPEDSSDIVAVGCYGSGEIASLAGATDTAVLVDLTIPAITGMTVASVTAGGVEIAGENGVYAVPKGDVLTVAFAPADGYVLGNPTMSVTMTVAGELPAEGRPVAMLAKDVISINEIMASNGETLTTENGGAELDWVELRNTSDYDVDLTGWYLYDDPTKKQSKWEKIQGNGVIPAHGCKVVWADKDYLDFSANEAYTRIGLSTSGEPLFLATPKGTKIQQIDNFGKQIKDVSYGLGHVERVILPAHADVEYRVGSGAWTPVQGPIGMSAAQSGFTCVTYFANTTVNNASDAEKYVANPSFWARPPVTNVSETIAFVGNNGGKATDFTYTGFPGGSSDNMIMIVTGSVYVPRPGQWTFAAGSDDGFTAALSRLGQVWTWEYPNTRSHAETYSTFNLPAAGAYDLRLLYFDKSGGKTIDVSVCEGEHDFEEGGFKLLGGIESGVVHAGALGGNVAVDLTDEMKGKTASAEWRADFTLAEVPVAGDTYRLRMRYADGFTAKVNGTQVAAVAATSARSPAEALAYSYFVIPSDLLVAGVNHLEVTGQNNAVGDGEFFLSPEVVWTRGDAEFVYYRSATPGAANGDDGLEAPTPEVQFSVPHGYKSEAFDLSLSCAEQPGAAIYYTLDGTSPSLASLRYTEPIRIAHTTVVRAAVPNVASVLQSDSSATYLFLEEVLTQPATAPDHFPTNKQINSQTFAYEMNPQIVAQNRDKILRGFTNSIATISIVIDPANLFDSSKGIYVNASGNGRSWERPTMVELITPTNAPSEFSVPAGLRIRGAYSRNAKYPKHSFRLFFRSEYGMGSLNYPLFGDEGASKFDKIDLRTAQNNSWANDDSYSPDFTFIEECFARDSQRDLGEPYNRSRYYNLFINGVYWGIYQTEERVSGDYGETYFGGVAEDYDVVRTSNPGYVTGVVEGTDDAWHAFWNLSVNEGYGPDHADNYKRAMGLNPDGTRNESYPIYLDPRNVMVHMLTAHYAADKDAPAAGDKANNMAALYNRTNSGSKAGWIFNRHDAEHSLGRHGSSVTHDRTLFGTEVSHTNFLKEANFNPAELNYKLMTNLEYRTAFGDLVYRECLREGGALTPAVAKARFQARMDQLQDAVVCESARWGWGKYTYDTWTNSCYSCLSFIENRLGYLIPQYRNRGWYPSIDPSVAVNGLGVPVADGSRVAFDERLYLTGGAAGTVYYTTDGSDPRLEGGAVSANATAYTGGSPQSEYAAAFGKKSSWKFFDWGSEPMQDASDRVWYATDYNESCDGAKAWGTGNGILGFQSGTQQTLGTTVVKFANHATSGTQVYTYYFRRAFDLPAAAASSTSLKINVFYDDGYVLYVNGVEVDRVNLPATGVGYGTFANGAKNESVERTLTIPAGLLKAGRNVIAAEVHQNQATSSDIYWDLGLSYVTAASTTGGLVVPQEGLSLTTRVLSPSGEWSALETLSFIGSAAPEFADPKDAVRVAGVMSSTVDWGTAEGDGDGSEWIALTNITANLVALNGVRITCAKTKKGVIDAPKCDFTLAGGEQIPPHGSIVLAKAAYWPTGKITNGEVEMRVYAGDGTQIQSLYFTTSWWGGACDGTGEHFITKAFGEEVREQSQWTTSFTAPVESPGAAVLDAVAAADGDVLREWLASIAAKSSGKAKLVAFAGTEETVRQCYLVNVTPETEPEIEVGIPFLALDADGKVQISGSLKLHGVETAQTVNGAINLYHAPTLEALPTSTDVIPLGTSFPVQKQTLDALAPSASRFFMLKVE